jgi:hypothetical protein
MTAVPDRNTFENAYAGQAPWDIGRPNKVLVDVADRITGSVLDAGCGTGRTPCTSPDEATYPPDCATASRPRPPWPCCCCW